MKSFIAFVLLVTVSLPAMAQEVDYVLPAEKWISKFTGFTCGAYGTTVAAPTDMASLNVAFETLTTDSTLDNGLIKATFSVDGKVCRYNAFVLADNDLATVKVTSSKAYAPAADADCAAGKAIIDAALLDNKYLYWGHPHNLTIMAPVAGAAAVCGGADLVGINFIVSGRVQVQE